MAPSGSPVIVITGAAGGIGAAFCRVAASHGASLVLCGRREASLAALAAELQTPTLVVAADVTKRADVERLLDRPVVGLLRFPRGAPRRG